MKKLLLLSIAASALLGGCDTMTAGNNYGNSGDWGYYDNGYHQQYGRYDYNSPDPSYNGYYADRYYQDNPRYHEHVLSNDDRVYRGHDGRYYCRRSDGSTGLIVGALAGGVLGSVIAEGDSRPLGALLGAIAGGAAGAAIDSNHVTCR
jgi:hypothetical protein